MAIEYDEKGKFFTDIISKEVVLSEIQMTTYIIRGNVHVRKGDRLSDEINLPNLFLPVTGAEIFSLEGEKLVSCNFLAVNREHIVWLKPIEDQPGSEEQ
jgi:hypothetical protein